MVHALRLLHKALVPHGVLADLRPDRSATMNRDRHPQLYCVWDGRRAWAGYITNLKPPASYRAADRAVRRVIREGLFSMQATEAFDFHYYFNSLPHLDRALAAYWTDAAVEAPTRRRLGKLLRRHPGAWIMAVSRIGLRVLVKR